MKAALGRFAGFSQGFIAWLKGFINTALYPVIFINYLAQWVPALKEPAWGVTLFGGSMNFDIKWLVAVAFMVPLAVLNIRGSRLVGDMPAALMLLILAPFLIKATADTDPRMEFLYESASFANGRQGVLAAYSSTVLDPSSVHSDFARWWPNLARLEPEVHTAWWSEEPESGLTYSAPRLGYLDALRAIRQPQGNLYFEGEHAEPLFGFVESALRSGLRVARHIGPSASTRK